MICFYVLFIVLSGFTSVNNVLAQEDIIEVEVEDKPIAINTTALTQTQSNFIYSWWFDGLLVSSIAIAGSFVVYFIINYFLKRTANSLRLDKEDLKGIRSIIKMIIIVITL